MSDPAPTATTLALAPVSGDAPLQALPIQDPPIQASTLRIPIGTTPPPEVPAARPGRSTLRERLVQERRIELLDAALLVFARRGYHATSLKEIAEEAGVTDGLLIHYFGSKANLLRTVLEHKRSVLAELEDLVEEAAEDDPEQALRTLATRWIGILQNQARPMIAVLLGEARYNPEVAEALAHHASQSAARTERLLARLAENGALRSDHLPIVARIFQWSLLWYTFGREIGPAYGLPGSEEWIEGLVDTLLYGLVPR